MYQIDVFFSYRGYFYGFSVTENRMYIFGGKNDFSKKNCLAEVFYFDLGTDLLKWTSVGTLTEKYCTELSHVADLCLMEASLSRK